MPPDSTSHRGYRTSQLSESASNFSHCCEMIDDAPTTSSIWIFGKDTQRVLESNSSWIALHLAAADAAKQPPNFHDALWHHLIADRLPDPRLVDEYKRIYTVILFIGKAIRRTHRGKGCRHRRMARRELLEFCWLGGVRWTRGQCQQQIAKVFAGGYRKEFEGVDHHVGVAAVRQMEFDGHAVWIGVGGPVRDIRYASRIRESHCRRNRTAVEQYGSAQPGGLRRRLEAALNNDALGVIGTKSRMDTKYLVHFVNELLLDRLILCPDDPNPC